MDTLLEYAFPENRVVVWSSIFAIGFFLALIKAYMQGGLYTQSTKCMKKVIIITGSNCGVGKETARELSRRGGIVYMACRDLQKAELARDDIIRDTGNNQIFVRYLDLASLESIRKFVEAFKAEQDRLDILINNAGVMYCGKMMTKDGFEMQMGVNHFGHFLLTNLLLDQLKKSAPSRIIVLSSLAHARGKINASDLNSENNYGRDKAYCQSKLANILFTRELAKRLQGTGVTVNAIHPGVVDTDLFRHVPIVSNFITNPIRKLLLWPFLKTAANGAQTSLYVALEPNLKNVSGKYFSDCKPKDVSKAAKDDVMGKWLWQESEKLTKLHAE